MGFWHGCRTPGGPRFRNRRRYDLDWGPTPWKGTVGVEVAGVGHEVKTVFGRPGVGHCRKLAPAMAGFAGPLVVGGALGCGLEVLLLDLAETIA